MANRPDDALDVESLVRRQVEQALLWKQQNVEPGQTKATKYYKGEPFGDEQEGRSQVVLQDLREAVNSVMPALMRVFFGSERSVAFKPRHPEDVALSNQQTEYINYIFTEDNPGFLETFSAFKDALIRKMGVLKWWVDEEERVEAERHEALTQQDLAVLSGTEGVEVRDLQQVGEGIFSGLVEHRSRDPKIRVMAVPPEEFVWSPSARSLDDARMVAHIRDLPGDELVAMGVDEEIVRAHQGGEDGTLGLSQLDQERRADALNRFQDEDEQPQETRPVRFAEVYTRIDEDDDGVAELRHIWLVGDPGEIVLDEPADHPPFALFGPDPEPHSLVGDSVADAVMQLQRIRSAITRGMLDSLAAHINPAQEVVDTEVNMADVLNKEVGRIIRAKRPGMIREIPTDFVGAAALPVLQYLDEEKDRASGIVRAGAGLDADALQSSTRMAVEAAIKASQAKVELIARIFAETGMKQLFRGLLRTAVDVADKPRIVRLRNQFVEVDPRSWDADKDLIVNVALGTGLVEEKMNILAQVLQKQEAMLQAGAPLVGLADYRKTLGRYLELAGFRNPDEFFKPFGPQDEAKLAQMKAQQPQPPSDNEVLLQVEKERLAERRFEKIADVLVKLAKLELDRAEVAGDQLVAETKVGLDAQSRAVELALERARHLLEQDTSLIDSLHRLSQTQFTPPPTEDAGEAVPGGGGAAAARLRSLAGGMTAQ